MFTDAKNSQAPLQKKGLKWIVYGDLFLSTPVSWSLMPISLFPGIIVSSSMLLRLPFQPAISSRIGITSVTLTLKQTYCFEAYWMTVDLAGVTAHYRFCHGQHLVVRHRCSSELAGFDRWYIVVGESQWQQSCPCFDS